MDYLREKSAPDLILLRLTGHGIRKPPFGRVQGEGDDSSESIVLYRIAGENANEKGLPE